MKEQPMSDEKTMGQIIQIDEARIRDHLGEMVRGTVEETLNAMLDAEADRLCGAGRYERSEARQDLEREVVAALNRTDTFTLLAIEIGPRAYDGRFGTCAPARVWSFPV
jgi:hypothetical protein